MRAPRDVLRALVAAGGCRIKDVLGWHVACFFTKARFAALSALPPGQRWLPHRIPALLLATQDQDGTYIILYQSTNHRKARSAGGSLFK